MPTIDIDTVRTQVLSRLSEANHDHDRVTELLGRPYADTTQLLLEQARIEGRQNALAGTLEWLNRRPTGVAL